jgi:hypothetical protein
LISFEVEALELVAGAESARADDERSSPSELDDR